MATRPQKRTRAAASVLAGHLVLATDTAQDDGEEIRTLGLGAVTLADKSADSTEPKWIQIAKCGEFKGHGAGAFALTPALFADICRNFTDVDCSEVAWDFEHASELEASEGSIPTEGAPAQGWIHQLDNRGEKGLWALTSWLEPARSYIQAKKYKFVSPAIRFNARHPVTGKPIGARLTSAALTNKPFLRGMVPVLATDRSTGAGRAAPPKTTTDAPRPQETITMTPEEIAALKQREAELASKNKELALTLKASDTRIVDLEAEKKALEAENKTLKDAEDVRLASDRDREVTEVIATYGKTKGLKDDDKDDLLALLSSSPKAFRKLYPPVDPKKRVLMTDISTKTRATETVVTSVDNDGAPAGDVKVNLRDAAKKLAREKGISVGAAQQLLLSQRKG